jgi:hypothetical protein
MSSFARLRAHRPLRWAALLLSVVGVAVACSRNSDPGFPKRSSLLDTEASRLAFKSPATWRYHPRGAAPLLARADLGQGDLLYAGEQGERWVFEKKSGAVSAAARLAPETIVAILKIDGGWLFVGESGTGYETREPLGGFVRASVPLDRLARVSAATSSVVGVTRDGDLVRSADAGASWKSVGAEDVRFVDVALMEGGKGLALSVPEAMWETKDDGATWKKLDVPSKGALGLAWDDVAGITVDTALGFKKWSPDAPTQLPDLGRSPKKGRFTLGGKPARGPDAAALVEGRALVQNNEYIEAASKSSSDSTWSLWRGAIGGRLREREFPAAKGCKAVRLASFDVWMYFACSIRSSGANQEFKIFRSQNRGKSFEEEPYTVEGRLGSLFLAVGAEGALSVTGICAPHDSTRGCSPYGIFHRRLAPADAGADGKADKKGSDAGDKKEEKKDEKKKEGPEYELSPAATPALKGSALALAFTPDGRTAFAVGRRTKGTSLAVFVSHDGGRSFEGREIDQLEPDYDTIDPGDRYSRPPPAPMANVNSVSVGEDGTLAIVLESFPPALIVVDEEGRVISFSRAPPSATALGAVGTRALAISANDLTAWESLDGGATWTSIGRLPSGTRARAQSGDRVVCHQSGCVVGTELSRVGWRGQADDDQGVLTTVDSTAGDLYDRAVRTPISCATEEKTWTAMPKVLEAPPASHAAIGKAVWYTLAQDDTKASATVYQATGGNRARVENVQLLAPATKAGTVAYAANYQVEGAAAIRYPIGETTTSLKNVEVVWTNLYESKVYRARIADAGPTTPSDFVRTGWAASRAQPAMMSIASGGIYLRPHGGGRDGQTTLFLDGRGQTSIPSISWTTSKSGSSEMVHVGGAHVPIQFLPNGAAVVRAKREGSGWVEEAFATGLVDFWRFGLTQNHELAYGPGGHAGIQVALYEVDGTRHTSWLFPIRASGAVVDAPIPTPMQRDTGDKPNRCGSAHKNDTARVISPFQGGTRHPVVVSDPVEPLRLLLTAEAVMHGSPSDPCVAAFDAEVVVLDPSIGTPEQERAILPLDDLEHSWLFRKMYDPNGEATVEYRMMSCRFDPGVEIPPETFSAAGTRVKRAH